ncbi:MAG: hypothetical protein J7J86_02855 [Bacteroidales bacterium]|nr:hypothetical protein [Bacteroidales bacterium]
MAKEENTYNLQKKEPKKKKKKRSLILDLFLGRIITNFFSRNISIIFFATILIIIYIANVYYTEKTIIKLKKIKRENRELKYKQITYKTLLMHFDKQSEIQKKVKETGLKESVTPPIIIYK